VNAPAVLDRTEKLWGHSVRVEWNPFMSFHRAEIAAGLRCSKHLHVNKWNGFFVESGFLAIRVYHDDGTEEITELRGGQYCSVAPGVKHRFESLLPTVLFEIYWPAEQTEDIIRDDEGGRI
jgi:mannose-6-phosphate isomerase-like protein (cupin superfamily)